MNFPLVYIILPVYNSEKSIKSCLDSLFKQKYTNFIIIAINDGSKDESLAILNEYSSRDTRLKIISIENHGVSYARNLGLDIACKQADFIAFCDSDDTVSPTWLSDMVDNADGMDLVVSGLNSLRNGVRVEPYYECDSIIDGTGGASLSETLITTKAYCFLFTKLFRTDIIRRNNIRFDPRCTFSEDQIFCMQYALYCKNWRFIPHCNYDYELPEAGKTYGNGETYYFVYNVFRALDLMYEGKKFSPIITGGYYKTLRNMIVSSLINNGKPEVEIIRYFKKLDKSKLRRSVKSKFADFILMKSKKYPRLSSFIIKCVQKSK